MKKSKKAKSPDLAITDSLEWMKNAQRALLCARALMGDEEAMEELKKDDQKVGLSDAVTAARKIGKRLKNLICKKENKDEQ